MPTIIDALLVTLGIDSSQFKKGTAEATDSLSKVKEGTTKSAKEIESRGKQITQAFRSIRNEVLALYATYKAAVGLDNFTRDITNSDAALGRLAHNIDMNVSELAAWEGAAERAGGSASGMGASIQGLMAQVQQFKITGQSGILPYMRALHVALVDVDTGKVRSMNDILLSLADSVQGRDPAEANALLSGLGLDQGTINLLEQGRAAVEAYLEQQRKLGVPSDADAKRAQKLRSAFLDFQQVATNLGRTILNDITPAVTSLLGQFSTWLSGAEGQSFAHEIGDDLRAILTLIRDPTWDHFGDAFGAAAERIGKELYKILMLLDGIINKVAGFLGISSPDTGSAGGANSAGKGWLDRLANPFPPDADNPNGVWSYLGRALGIGGNSTTQKTINPFAPGYRSPAQRDPGAFSPSSGIAAGNATPISYTTDSGASPEGQALLDQIAVGESGGRYNVRYSPTGDQTFVPGADHPRIYEPTPDGSGVSSAAGKYQFTATTWDEMQRLREARGLGRLPDFSPVSQEKAGWFWVQEIYRRQFPGHDLTADLKAAKHDPALLAGIANAMHAEWTSAPGGSEPNNATAGFIPQLEARLNAIPDASPTLLALLDGVKAAVASMAQAKRDQALVPSAGRFWAGSSGRRIANTSTSETHVGTINIHTRATNAKGIATDIGDAMSKYAFVVQANTGLG